MTGTAHGLPLPAHGDAQPPPTAPPPLCDTCAWLFPRAAEYQTFRCLSPAAVSAAVRDDCIDQAPLRSELVLAKSITSSGGCLYHKPGEPWRAVNPPQTPKPIWGVRIAAAGLVGFLLHALLLEAFR